MIGGSIARPTATPASASDIRTRSGNPEKRNAGRSGKESTQLPSQLGL
jgi:hypothetical protein